MKRKVNYLIIILLAFLSVGFAALTTTIVFNGEVTLLANADDFEVVFTSTTTDDGFSYISSDGNTLTYVTPKLVEVGDEAVLHYTVSNNSREFDANVEINMLDEKGDAFDSEYVSIENTVPLNSTISANESAEGVLTVKLLKASDKDMSIDFELTIDAASVERDSVVEPINSDFSFNGLEPGLYDENNLMLASWDELVNNYGLDVESDTNIDINEVAVPESVKELVSRSITITDYYSIMGNLMVSFGYVESEHAFANVVKNNPELSSGTSLVIGNNVSRIGANAFSLSSKLVNIYVPSNVVEIGNDAFTCCKNLVNLQLDCNITSIPNRFVFFDSSLDVLNIPEGVTEIGNNAFGFAKIKKLHLPSTFSSKIDKVFDYPTFIGYFDVAINNPTYKSVDGVLYNADVTVLYNYPTMKKDSSFTFPDTLEYVGSESIIYNQFLKHIYFDSMVSLTDDAIGGNSELIDITFNQGIEKYSESIQFNKKLQNIYVLNTLSGYNDVDGILFYRNNILYYPSGRSGESYTTPENSQIIQKYAFTYNQNLKHLIISEGVTTIEDNAIYDCNLETITIPSTVSSIGRHNFEDCDKLVSIDVSENNNNFKFTDGVLYNKDETKIYTYLFTKTDEEYTVPSGVTNILLDGWANMSVFYRNEHLKTINFPAGIKGVTNDYLGALPNLTNVNISDGSDNYISVNGIVYNKDMTKLVLYPRAKSDVVFTVPSGITTIGEYAFARSINLSQIVLPDGLKIIEKDSFEDIDNLTSITIPASVTTINYDAFYSCDRLKNVVFENPNGWKYGNELLSSNDLSDSSKAAAMLRSTNYNGYGKSWTRAEE
jgi:hypothetical protein